MELICLKAHSLMPPVASSRAPASLILVTCTPGAQASVTHAAVPCNSGSGCGLWQADLSLGICSGANCSCHSQALKPQIYIHNFSAVAAACLWACLPAASRMLTLALRCNGGCTGLAAALTSADRSRVCMLWHWHS